MANGPPHPIPLAPQKYAPPPPPDGRTCTLHDSLNPPKVAKLGSSTARAPSNEPDALENGR